MTQSYNAIAARYSMLLIMHTNTNTTTKKQQKSKLEQLSKVETQKTVSLFNFLR